MKFYYENSMGDEGTFEEDDLVKAIYMAWNIEASLYLIADERMKFIFEPMESNEFNSDLLNAYGYYMLDGEKYREIANIKTDEIIRYDWAEVKQLT